ncbi:MAG: OsmC family protein [Desulfobacterales bacterium]|jgi:putative redox protein|nr:OsmC family protein [Desulfobacterales bacterium]MDP6808955.1 OsmC family protein [Desulfobacterales bacterium]MDP7077321.1 OsmC family protein [Desulfobacterales bacterium]HJO62622.1 OsmC family protein [Desulfobacterales bacterium]|tara:strand:- start:3048 stop:3458 length:411 start_codon:yes stop_codon:yes gene_type:complete
MSIHAQLNWTDGSQFVARVGNGPAVVIDTPEGGSGPTPMGILLMGVAGCTAVDVVSILKKKRVNMTGFQINITGERAEKEPMRYTNIHIEYIVHGKDIKPKAVEHAIQLSEEKYCSAIASLNATVSNTYRIFERDE